MLCRRLIAATWDHSSPKLSNRQRLNEYPDFIQLIKKIHRLWTSQACPAADTSMFAAQIVNIPPVLSLSLVNESAVTEPGGPWPGQLLCGWLSDGQNAHKRSAALLMWWRLFLWLCPAVSWASPPELSSRLEGQTFSLHGVSRLCFYCGLRKYLLLMQQWITSNYKKWKYKYLNKYFLFPFCSILQKCD